MQVVNKVSSRRNLLKIIEKWKGLIVHQPRNSSNCSYFARQYAYHTSGKYRFYSTKMAKFKFSNYDCVGFDLDNTLLRYNLTNMVTLEYNTLAKFLVEERGYDSKYLYQTLTPKDYDFLQKGLILDLERGNVIKMNPQGGIVQVSHGTRALNDLEIDHIYPGRRWWVTDKFAEDMLITWNGPLSEKMRPLLDYFDMPASLIFAKIVDTLDEKNNGQPSEPYNIWPDVLAGLIFMFERDNFAVDSGHYFPALKQDPDRYLHRCSPRLVAWLTELKKNKITYLITGSNSDFADFTASYALGADWKKLFDVIICYGRKPGFFTHSRPFLRVEDHLEKEEVAGEDLERGKIYSQGNLKSLQTFFSNVTQKARPCCLYVGDNLIQDVYTPKFHGECDTIAIVEEQLAEGMLDHSLSHVDERILTSEFWGSYFLTSNGQHSVNSVWAHVINRYSKICVPSMEFLIQNSLDTPLESFDTSDKKFCGYYPAKPVSIAAHLSG